MFASSLRKGALSSILRQSRCTAIRTLSTTASSDDSHSRVLFMAAAALTTAAAVSFQDRAECCGIAGVVGTQGNDARYVPDEQADDRKTFSHLPQRLFVGWIDYSKEPRI